MSVLHFHPFKIRLNAFIKLPNELLHLIFNPIVSSLYSRVFNFDKDKAFRLYVHAVDDGERDILAAIQVCRTWHAVGTRLLYAKPFLITRRRIRRFSVSLEEYSHLGDFVQDVSVLEEPYCKAGESEDSVTIHEDKKRVSRGRLTSQWGLDCSRRSYPYSTYIVCIYTTVQVANQIGRQ